MVTTLVIVSQNIAQQNSTASLSNPKAKQASFHI